MTRKTLVIFEQFPELTRLFLLDPDSEHMNAAIVAAGDAASMEAMEQFVKLVEDGQLKEISTPTGIVGFVDGSDDAIDRVIMVSCDG